MSIAAEPKGSDRATRPEVRREHARRGVKAIKALGSMATRGQWRNRVVLGLLLLASIVLVSAAVIALTGGMHTTDQPLVLFTAQHMDLPITVTERGNLESQHNVEIICEVESVGDRYGGSGTTILQIVPNGSSVKKGDLLVELDSSQHQDRLDRQVLDTERARAEFIQAQAKLENQKTQNETSKADAQLEVRLAELELRMFVDKDNGTHKLEVEEINRTIDDVKNEILAAQASLELSKNEKRGIEALFKLGYAGKSELDRTRLDFLQAESLLAAKLNRLETQKATLEKKISYEEKMQLLTLEGKKATAERNLKQVERDNEALMAQATAAYHAADEALKKEEEKLKRYQQQLVNCKIYAPQDGMVAYASSGRRYGEEIREGAQVRYRQRILTLPNLQKMQVKTAVHESVLDQVQRDLPATVRVDAFPERRYKASVTSVAVLPDQEGWMSSDTKVYETYVSIDEDVTQLKPGMTAVVEIHVDRLDDVLCVPVQAITQIQGDSWCYVSTGGKLDRRIVSLGRTNDKYVEISEGLEAGERIVLNPRAVVDPNQDKSSPISPDGTTRSSASDI